ncbi:hypothetical protein BU15DRAFT_89074 [Melanogaster broomeanus]|nr:hypothetical protein BU15DRAFT_89074 [Melanogaster broomeanus]
MPAPEIAAHSQDHHVKTLGHVLQVDTLIANSTIDDLRAITRTLLATGTPSLAAHLQRRHVHDCVKPTQNNVLARARSLYGAGMGFTSLSLLSSVVTATVGLRWEQEGSMADILAVIDADICQAIQSCKEELEGGRVNDLGAARETINKIWTGVEDSSRDVEVWGGEFPYDKTASSIQCWRI